MDPLEKYGALVEPTIGLPYSTSGGYGPGGVFMSPMADYYSAFAPSAFVNRALVDYPNTASAVSQQGQDVVAMPADSKELTKDQKERTPQTVADIYDYHKVFKELSGLEQPYWPKAILMEPSERGKAKKASGQYFPDRQAIELYGRQGAGYVQPDLQYVDQAYWQKGKTDSTLPHELAHFVDNTYKTAEVGNKNVPLANIEDLPFVTDIYSGYGGNIEPSVLLNEMPRVSSYRSAKNPKDPGYIYSPTIFRREMAAGEGAPGASETELYADQLGKALNLWKNSYAHPKAEEYAIAPVTLSDMARYNAVAEKSPYIGLGDKLMSPELITRNELAAADNQAFRNSMAFARPGGRELGKEFEAAARQDEIARTILMEMALNRLQRDLKPSVDTPLSNTKAGNLIDTVAGYVGDVQKKLGAGDGSKPLRVLDPVTGQLLPVAASQQAPSNFRIRVVPKKR